MANLLIVRGLPGSGKSTFAKRVAFTMNMTHVEADMFFVDKSGQYNFDPLKLKEAHEWCQNRTRTLLDSGKDVIVSNTFVKKWEAEPYLKMTKNVSIIVMKSEYDNIHGVPAEVIERMKNSWEEFSVDLYNPRSVVFRSSAAKNLIL